MPPELNPQQKKRITKVGLFAENKDLAHFDVMQEIADSLEKLAGAETVHIQGKQGVKGEKGDKGDRGEKGDSVRGEQGIQGIKGDKGDVGPQGNDGKDGRDGRDGRNGVDGVNGLDGLPGLPGRDGKDAPAGSGGSKVGWGAHPLQIQDDGVIIDKVARVINFTGGTVTRSASGVISVPIGGGGGSGYQAPLSGALTGTNTWTSAPSVLVIDGVPRRQTQSDGTVNWTGTTTTVLTGAPLPNFDIFAL